MKVYVQTNPEMNSLTQSLAEHLHLLTFSYLDHGAEAILDLQSQCHQTQH